MPRQDGGGKLPGKTLYSGRRRSVTRRSGFKAHEGATGGEYRVDDVASVKLKGGDRLELTFEFPEIPPGALAGFGFLPVRSPCGSCALPQRWPVAPRGCIGRLSRQEEVNARREM